MLSCAVGAVGLGTVDVSSAAVCNAPVCLSIWRLGVVNLNDVALGYVGVDAEVLFAVAVSVLDMIAVDEGNIVTNAVAEGAGAVNACAAYVVEVCCYLLALYMQML